MHWRRTLAPRGRLLAPKVASFAYGLTIRRWLRAKTAAGQSSLICILESRDPPNVLGQPIRARQTVSLVLPWFFVGAGFVLTSFTEF